MKFNVLTNSRPTTDLGSFLVVGCTPGNIKVTPDFAKLIGVAPKSRMIVAEDMDNPGDFYAYADASDGKDGSLLAKSGSYFQMSSQNTWDILGGDENLNKFFAPDGEVQEVEGVKVQKIKFEKAEEKTQRVASSDKEQSTTQNASETENDVTETANDFDEI
jgi:hypothetical protein